MYPFLQVVFARAEQQLKQRAESRPVFTNAGNEWMFPIRSANVAAYNPRPRVLGSAVASTQEYKLPTRQPILRSATAAGSENHTHQPLAQPRSDLYPSEQVWRAISCVSLSRALTMKHAVDLYARGSSNLARGAGVPQRLLAHGVNRSYRPKQRTRGS